MMQQPQSTYLVVGVEQNSTEARRAFYSMIPRKDWSRLVGANVDVYRDGRFFRTGRVDQVTCDGQVAWIGPSGVDSRIMIDKARGYELCLRYQPSPKTA